MTETNDETGTTREPTEAESVFAQTIDGFENSLTEAMTDGGRTVADIVDDEVDNDDHYLLHVTPSDEKTKKRHTCHIETDVEAGHIVHNVTVKASEDAHKYNITFSKRRYTCPVHGRDDADTERQTVDGEIVTTTTCTAEGCPFEASTVQKHAPYGTSEHNRPVVFTATVPHNFEAKGIGADTWGKFDDDDKTDAANVARRLHVDNYVDVIHDTAYVKAEFDDDHNKTADAYIDRFTCPACDKETDAGVEVSHPHYGEVCPACEDVTVWDMSDVDLPDDVDAELDAYKSVTAQKLRELLRDVEYWDGFVSKVKELRDGAGGMFHINDDAPEPADVPPCPTGKQGKVNMGRGQGGQPGTGLRRPDGVAHGDRFWRKVVQTAKETGLIERADNNDVDDDHEDARWTTTDKGVNLLQSLSVCRYCGNDLKPYVHVHGHKTSPKTTYIDRDLVLACPEGCDDVNGTLKPLNGVQYDD